MTVRETLEQLSALQGIDEAIRALAAELEQLPKNLEAAQEDHAAIQARHQEAVGARDAILKRRRDLETQIEQSQQNVIKYENDKIKVKTNNEFRALNTQIESEKQKQSGLEDHVLVTYEEEEKANAVVEKFKTEVELVARTVAQREGEIKERGAADEKRIAELRDHREKVAAAVEPRMLARYENLRRAKGGVAMSYVVRNACGGCQSSQPAQKMNEVRKMTSMQTCETCGRYLVWPAEETSNS